MSVSTTSNLSNSLRRTYSDRYFKAFQNDFTQTLDELDECPDEPALGSGWFFPFNLASEQNNRVAAEGGGMGDVNQRTEVQGQVNVVEFLAWIQLSELLKNVGAKGGALNGANELNRQIKEATTGLSKLMQRMFVISHGTGRLAVIENDTTSLNTFVGKNDEGVTNLMVNDVIDVYTLDSGGSSAITSRKITDINRRTRTVTFSGAAASLTADYGVYKASDYGRGSNGFHGLIDNGAFTDNVHGQSRTTYSGLNAQVRDPGTPTALEEEHMREICDDIFLAGGEVDKIACNVGVMNAFFDIQGGDRRYNIERGQTAKMVLGYREGDALFSYDKGSMVIRKDQNMPARTMYFYSLKSFYKHTVRKLGWLDEGGSLLRLTPNSNADGFLLSWTALLYAAVNISCCAPPWNGVRRNILDKSLAGDS